MSVDNHGSGRAESQIFGVTEFQASKFPEGRCVSILAISPLILTSINRRIEIQKLSSAARSWLYIQLASFPSHYLVLVITDEEFRFALISVEVRPETLYGNLIMKDIGWLDIRRIHGDGRDVTNVVPSVAGAEAGSGEKRKRDGKDEGRDKIKAT